MHWMNMTEPLPPPPISIADILSETELLQRKEQADKSMLESIGSQTFDSLRGTLIQWGVAGFPVAYPILSIQVTPPPVCSDGVARNLADYITFCSGKSINEHVAILQSKLSDIVVSYANVGGAITIVLSTA